MSPLDPILPSLGPLGQLLGTNSNDILVLLLGFIGLVSLGIYMVQKNVFETSKAWVGATVALSFITILFRGMGAVCGCTWYTDNTGAVQQLVPVTYLLISGSFFAILYNFNIPFLKKHKWLFSIPLSIPLAIVSNTFFPLVSPTPAWAIIEIALLSPIGAIYSSFVYERAVLHMGDYKARMRRFLESTERNKKVGVGTPVEKEGFSYFTYSLLGRRLGKLFSIFSGLKEVISQAGMKIGYKAYVSEMVFAAMVGGGLSFFVWFAILNLGLGAAFGLTFSITSVLLTIVISIGLAFLTGAVILGVFYMLPFMRVGSRRQRLDNFLPFTASYMTVLASAGVTPERILRSTAEKDPKFMLSDEIANVIGRIDLLGYDVINAMNAETERSPSTNYQDLLRGFAGVIRTGGDMKKFFQGITDHLFQKRALSVQSFLDSLGIIAETYVLMLIAFPLMLVVMLSIMASIGGSLGGVDVFSFMYLLAFILIPICGVMFLFILDSMQPKG
ncbi:MAG TPA: type II secretion system F family protein [Candidatus Bathyarchaeia archaeon]|nr:type II secretion system F family protein [Candidatus Bathyarchaeia archaeon]